MGKKTIKIMMCDQCGSLVGDSGLHSKTQHPITSTFVMFEIEIPVTKRKKKVGNRNKT